MKNLRSYIETFLNESSVLDIEEVRIMVGGQVLPEPQQTNGTRFGNISSPMLVSMAAALVVVVISAVWIVTRQNNLETALSHANYSSELEYRWGRLVSYLENPVDSTRVVARLAKFERSTAGGEASNSVPLHLRVKLEPSEEVLDQVGITRVQNKVTYSGNIRGAGFLRFQVTPQDRTVFASERFLNAREFDFYPLFMTDEYGRHEVKYAFSSESDDKLSAGYFEKVMNELIPIQVKVPGSQQIAVFWYKATPSLLAVLEGELHFEDKFEGAISENSKSERPKMFPNPTTGDFSIQIESRTRGESISIDLLDMSGSQAKNLLNQYMLSDGQNNFQFEISGFPNGIYFVRISSSSGQYSIQRLFKQ